jgi:hypothetical protein
VFTPAALFSDDFANNSKGWSFVAGQGWQIGALPAITYMPLQGFPDPTADHTPTADNGVAGVYLGVQTPKVNHAEYYFTSPIINLNAAPAAHLEFWRWLNSDYPPYANSTIEVFNGSSWVTIFTMTPDPGPEITDNAWMKQAYDVTAHKNASFRVRFSWSITNATEVFDYTNWNIDDLRIMPVAGCP